MLNSRARQPISIAALAVTLAVGIAATTATVAGQASVPAGQLSGRVTATDGNPVPGVVVSVGVLPAVPGGETRQVTTDADGGYTFTQLTPGPWSLTFSGQRVEVGGRVDLAADRGRLVGLVVNRDTGQLLQTTVPTDVQESAFEQPVAVGPLLPRPVRVQDFQAVYPGIARMARMQGTVEFELLIGQDGRVRPVKVLKSMPMLDQAALDAVRQWRFAPTLINGVPTSVTAQATVTYSVNLPVGVGELRSPTASPASPQSGSR